MIEVGGQSEVAPISRLLLKHPKDAFGDDRRIEAEWRDLRWSARPDLQRAAAEYDAFVDLLRATAGEILFLPCDEATGTACRGLHFRRSRPDRFARSPAPRRHHRRAHEARRQHDRCAIQAALSVRLALKGVLLFDPVRHLRCAYSALAAWRIGRPGSAPSQRSKRSS